MPSQVEEDISGCRRDEVGGADRARAWIEALDQVDVDRRADAPI